MTVGRGRRPQEVEQVNRRSKMVVIVLIALLAAGPLALSPHSIAADSPDIQAMRAALDAAKKAQQQAESDLKAIAANLDAVRKMPEIDDIEKGLLNATEKMGTVVKTEVETNKQLIDALDAVLKAQPK